MVNISVKLKERIIKGIKKFQPVLLKAQAADINESDTVTIITDILCDVFGYDKYENITSEFAIKKTYCDLAVKMQEKVVFLIECKAIGIDLKDDHIRQATNYSADSGIEWVVLTNGLVWKVYRVLFQKPVDKQLIYEFNLCEISTKKQSDIEMLYYLCMEAFSKSSKATINDFYIQKQILNKYTLGQIILTDPVVENIRRAVKKLYPDVKVSSEEITNIIYNEIFKREIIESDPAAEAKRAVQKAERKLQPVKTKHETCCNEETEEIA